MKHQKRKPAQDQNFLPRRERVKKIKVPESNSGCIVIKPNNEGLGYRLDGYDEEILGHLIDRERFSHTIFQCSRICQTVWSQKRVLEEGDPMQKAKANVIRSVVLLIAGLVLFFLSAYGKYEQDTQDLLGIIGCAFIVAQAIIALTIVMVQLFSQEIVKINLEEECKRKLKEYLSNENDYYNSKYLNWVIGENFFWLQLFLMAKT